MKTNYVTNSVRALKLLTLFGVGLWFQPFLKADVVVLQDGRVLTGTVLKKDSDGVPLKMETGSGLSCGPQSCCTPSSRSFSAAPGS